MSIASEIARLQGVKADILDAIEFAGIDVPAGTDLADCPTLIKKITGADIGGRIYRTVTIGSLTWMAENLDYKFTGLKFRDDAQSNPLSTLALNPEAAYYNYDETTYGVTGNKYGLLYNGTAASYLNTNRATLCPGWRLPTQQEWIDLLAVGNNEGLKYKATYGWTNGTGTDDYKFSALPGGFWYDDFMSVGTGANYWTSTPNQDTTYYINFVRGNDVSVNGWETRENAFSLRLVKDTST